LKEKVATSAYKTKISAGGDPPRLLFDPLYPQKFALTSPISGGRSFGIVRSRTKATEVLFHCKLEVVYLLGYKIV
jgi:hypothetical protein